MCVLKLLYMCPRTPISKQVESKRARERVRETERERERERETERDREKQRGTERERLNAHDRLTDR
jgi:hypothetical protein